MWIPDGIRGRFLRGIGGRVAVIVGEEIPQMSFFRVEIQLEVDDGRVVGRGAGVFVLEHLVIVKRAGGGKPRPHGIA